MELREWLAGLDEVRLTRLLSTRRDAVAPPWPRRLDDLASRLSDHRAAMDRLPLPAHEVLEAAQVDPHLDALAVLLGTDPDTLAPFLELLEDHAVAWRDGDLLHCRTAIEFPLRLGRTAESFLLRRTSAITLRHMAGLIGLRAEGGRRELADRLVAFYRDPYGMELLLKGAPDGVPELLDDFAWRGPELIAPEIDYGSGSPTHWARDRGLIWRTDWSRGHMPREVALAVRGPDYHAPFTPRAPHLPTVAVDDQAVSHEAAAAAARTLDRTTALLGACPIPLLKAGGVGVREIRRIARELACTEDETRLYLEIAAVARLIAPTDGALQPTARGWLALPADARHRALIAAWWRMERCSIWEAEGKPQPALGDWPRGTACAVIRHAVLALMAELPADQGCSDAEAIVRSIVWRSPLLITDPPLRGPTPRADSEIASAVPGVIAEAVLLGLSAQGSLSPLGRALAPLAHVAGTEACADAPLVISDPELIVASTAAMAGLREEALFGADLTAVVTGPASPGLAALLDLAADRESQGAATVWRFGPASVRRALDAGVHDLVERLTAVASGSLPQPLAYLIGDAARRHGEAAVITVNAVVRGEPALIASLAADRKLARAGLSMIAPTVLVSRSPAREVLAALRSAGYSPVPSLPDGTVIVERTAVAGDLYATAPEADGQAAAGSRTAAGGQGTGDGRAAAGDSAEADGRAAEDGQAAADGRADAGGPAAGDGRAAAGGPAAGDGRAAAGGRGSSAAPTANDAPIEHTRPTAPNSETAQRSETAQGSAIAPGRSVPSPADHARRLITAEPAPNETTPTWSTLRRRASHLPPSATSVLGLLIEHDLLARIQLKNGDEIKVSHGELHDGIIEAWSYESGAYERFSLTDITAAHPTTH